MRPRQHTSLTFTDSSSPVRSTVLAIESNKLESPTQRRSGMSKVAAYHSTNESDPDVYHDDDNCPSGKQIPSWNKAAGTNGWPLCGHCKDM